MCNNNKGEEDIEKRSDYLKVKEEYRMLSGEKKKKEGESIVHEIKSDRRDRKFWEHMKGNKERNGTGEKIKDEEWKRHFMDLLGRTEIGEDKEEEEEKEKRKKKKAEKKRRGKSREYRSGIGNLYPSVHAWSESRGVNCAVHASESI